MDLTWADEHVNAIMQCWYPGAQGGNAIAQVLFGDACPEGRLPVTFYRTSEELPEFTDYSMEGRTYRYMKISRFIRLDMVCHTQSFRLTM